MIESQGLVDSTRKGFQYQWTRRLLGRAEHGDTIYGYDARKFMAWFARTFTRGLQSAANSGQWLLDAGCGSAEKARELAILYPRHEVVALDIVELGPLAKRYENFKNLHFVQANVLHPPFAEFSIQFLMSIGVLHHVTPNTKRAFDVVSKLVAEGGELMTWIYPLPEEDSFWAGLYRQRDRHFMGLGHRLPPALTMTICRAYVAVLLPWLLKFVKREFRINKERFPIYPERPSLGSLYRSLVFLSFDNVMPRHQFRHGREEVRAWYLAAGFGEVSDRYPGFFHAVRETRV